MVVNTSSVRYDEDFNGWIEHTVDLLKARRFEELDIDSLIDELESMSKRDKREILSRLTLIVIHLLNGKSSSQSAACFGKQPFATTAKKLPKFCRIALA